VPADRANRQAGADTQCRRLSFVGWSLRVFGVSAEASLQRSGMTFLFVMKGPM
jgi:hypothetical protein